AIVVRQVDVVYADEHAGGQLRQDVQEEHDGVGVHEHAMRAVQEHDVAAAQLVEHVEVRALDRLPHDPVADGVDLAAWIWVERDDLHVDATVAARAVDEQRRVARSDLHVAAWRVFAGEAIERYAVQAEQVAVAPARLPRVALLDADGQEIVGVGLEFLQDTRVVAVPTPEQL